MCGCEGWVDGVRGVAGGVCLLGEGIVEVWFGGVMYFICRNTVRRVRLGEDAKRGSSVQQVKKDSTAGKVESRVDDSCETKKAVDLQEEEEEKYIFLSLLST